MIYDWNGIEWHLCSLLWVLPQVLHQPSCFFVCVISLWMVKPCIFFRAYLNPNQTRVILGDFQGIWPLRWGLTVHDRDHIAFQGCWINNSKTLTPFTWTTGDCFLLCMGVVYVKFSFGRWACTRPSCNKPPPLAYKRPPHVRHLGLLRESQ